LYAQVHFRPVHSFMRNLTFAQAHSCGWAPLDSDHPQRRRTRASAGYRSQRPAERKESVMTGKQAPTGKGCVSTHLQRRTSTHSLRWLSEWFGPWFKLTVAWTSGIGATCRPIKGWWEQTSWAFFAKASQTGRSLDLSIASWLGSMAVDVRSLPEVPWQISLMNGSRATLLWPQG